MSVGGSSEPCSKKIQFQIDHLRMSRSIVFPFLIVAAFIITAFLVFENLEGFFSNLLLQFNTNSTTYALISFLVLTSDIVLPVPSSIVMYSNGYVLGIINGTIISIISLSCSCVIGYYLGKLTSLGLKKADDEKANEIISNYGTLSILITRGIPILSESVSIICGYNKMPFRNYFLLNVIGYLPLCLLYAYCGSIGYNESMFLISFICSLIISALFWLFGKFYLSKSSN